MKTNLRSTALLVAVAGLTAGSLSVGAPSSQPLGSAGLTQYTFGNPSNDETEILEVINRARANPAAEGQRLVDALNAADYVDGVYVGDDVDHARLLADFQSYPARPPLAFNAELNAAAQYHLPQMVAAGQWSHYSPNGDYFDVRVRSFGYAFPAAENVAGSATSFNAPASETEYNYEVDVDVPSYGHRLNVMEPNQIREVEVGVAQQALGGWNVEDFGGGLAPALLTGVAFTNNDGTGFYAPGEGVGGVTVTALGASSFYAVTVASGAYTLPLDLLTFDAAAVNPTVQVMFTDAAGKMTTQTVTLNHTVGTDGVSTYHDTAGKVRYDNAKADLVEVATVTPTPTPNPTPTPTPAMPQVTVAPSANGHGFVLTRSGDTSTTLLVTYVVKGTAAAGQDYVPLTGTKKIKAGKSSVSVNVQILPGAAGTVKLKAVSEATYSVGVTTGQAKIKLGPQG